MFDIDDTTDLNVLLDFLTDNYPETFDEFSRKDFLTKKIAKEYLKVIYQ